MASNSFLVNKKLRNQGQEAEKALERTIELVTLYLYQYVTGPMHNLVWSEPKEHIPLMVSTKNTWENSDIKRSIK